MLELIVYKNTYTISLIGGGVVLRGERKDHHNSIWYCVHSTISYKISNVFFEKHGYSLIYKGEEKTFNSLSELSDFVATKAVKN